MFRKRLLAFTIASLAGIITGCGSDDKSSSSASSSSSSSSSVSTSSADSSSSSSVVSSDEKTVNSVTAPEGYTSATLLNCGVNAETLASSKPLFNKDVDLLGGWSHITATPEFANLTNEDKTVYSYANFVTLANADCNENMTHNVILVKKYANWDKQHASGVNAEFLAEDIQFGEIENIIVEFKVNSEGTYIPTLEEINAAYGTLVADEVLADLDHGKINLGITLYAAGDQTATAVINGARIIELEAEVLDQWVRVTIPAASLDWYSEMNYTRTDLSTVAAYEDGTVLGLRINPEVTNEKVLRNFIADTWDETAPPVEMFKEMDIDIKRVELQLK